MKKLKIAFLTIVGIIALSIVLTLILPSYKRVVLPAQYKCPNEGCIEIRGVIEVEELKNNEDLVEETVGPIIFKSLGQYAKLNCVDRCKEKGYSLYAKELKQGVNQITGENGYKLTCYCASYEG